MWHRRGSAAFFLLVDYECRGTSGVDEARVLLDDEKRRVLGSCIYLAVAKLHVRGFLKRQSM